MMRLSELAGSRPCSTRQVLLDAVELDLQRRPVADRHRLGERAAVADADLLDRAQRGAGGPPDVVGPGLQAVELLDDDERHDDVDAVERDDARRVGDEHGGVEHHPGAHGAVGLGLTSVPRRGRREEIGQRHSFVSREGIRLVGWVRERTAGEMPNGTQLYRARGVRCRDDGQEFIGPSRGTVRGVAFDPRCPFCAIVAGTAEAEVVFRDDVAVGFLDIRPLFPGHVLIVPVDHVVTLPELDDVGPFFERVQRVAGVLPTALGAQGTFVANNNVVSQSVAHLHVHVVPRTKGDGLRGFFWPRSKYRPGEAAAVATTLREALATTG